MNKIQSPITQSTNVKKLDVYDKCISSEGLLMHEHVSNYLCLDTGLIFNGTGARGQEREYYGDEYDLHNENDESEFKYQTDEGFIGVYENIFQFIDDNIDISLINNYLDIGCGKGLLLKKFSQNHNKLNLFGIEPSKQASKMYKRIIPEAEIFLGSLEESEFRFQKFELISANGVLEHVPNPIEFLNSISNMLTEEGYCYIGVPNFKTNPADIFTYDHLSRFTPKTIKMLFSLTGFEVISELVSDVRVPMWYLIKKNKQVSKYSINITDQQDLFDKHSSDIKKTFQSIQNCYENNIRDASKIAVYGTGSIFSLATFYTDINFSDIYCYVDDNDSIHGSKKNGITIQSPQILQSEKISKIIISGNPCYHDQIIKRIHSLNLNSFDLYY